MSSPSKYSWKFYLLVAHLVDDSGRTACSRVLPNVDEPDKSWDGFTRKCKTCQLHYEKHGFQIIVKEESGEKQA